jgi:prepilin-type N-terminal cleavage/methylation domain-containing protein
MKAQRYTRSCSGFTVSELMVTIGVAGILMGIAVPSLLAWLPTLRLNDGARQVAVDLQNARMTAISQSLPMGLSFTGATAYVIFQDANLNGAYDNPGDPIVRGPFSLPQGITAAAAATVVFQPRGVASVTNPINLGNGTAATANLTTSLVGRVTIYHSGGS